LALLIALYASYSLSTALYALIPIGIGLSDLIYYFTVGKKEAEALQRIQEVTLADTDRFQ
jgi:hypothetical protein